MNYHNITQPDMLNGNGLRVVLWVAGCSHHCKGCHNPITWDANGGIKFDEKAEEEIFNALSQTYIKGLTLSGGDPLNEANVETLLELVDKVKSLYPTKDIWIYSGYTYDYLRNSNDPMDIKRRELVEKCDIFVDGKFVEELKDKNLHWKGSSNQIIWDMKTKTPLASESSEEVNNNSTCTIDGCNCS